MLWKLVCSVDVNHALVGEAVVLLLLAHRDRIIIFNLYICSEFSKLLFL